jgi:hypothetical protein
MRLAVALLAVVALSVPSGVLAQTKRQCRTIANNADSMIGPAIVNLNRVERMGPQIAGLKANLSGELGSSLERFDEARRNLAIALREFVDASRELRGRSEACS